MNEGGEGQKSNPVPPTEPKPDRITQERLRLNKWVEKVRQEQTERERDYAEKKQSGLERERVRMDALNGRIGNDYQFPPSIPEASRQRMQEISKRMTELRQLRQSQEEEKKMRIPDTILAQIERDVVNGKIGNDYQFPAQMPEQRRQFFQDLSRRRGEEIRELEEDKTISKMREEAFRRVEESFKKSNSQPPPPPKTKQSFFTRLVNVLRRK